MGCKGLGVALKETIQGHNELSNWLTWVVLLVVAVCITIQMNYLNKALDIFNTSVVTPILYVIFTTFVIAASAILFKEWQRLEPHDVIGTVCGFLTTVSGVFLLQAFKDMEVSLSNLPKARKETEMVMMAQNGTLPPGGEKGDLGTHKPFTDRVGQEEMFWDTETEDECHVHIKRSET